MIRYHASWVVPIAQPPIRNGWVAVEQGRVIGVGHGLPTAAADRDLGSVAILPGLVNAHTHLELSHLHERVPQSTTFVDWIRAVVESRRSQSDSRSTEIAAGIAVGIAQSIRCGTAVVGDISNSLASFGPLAKSALAGIVFYELIRFNAPDPEGVVAEACHRIDALGHADRVRASLAAHAPYSVAPAVFGAIRRAIDRRALAPCSVHLSESRDEVEFIRHGGGEWRRFLEDVGAWDPAWIAPGVTPVEFLAAAGFLDASVLAVHGVQMTAADLVRLAALGTTLVACPRSNRHTGAGVSPVAEFYASGVRVAVGTDSLASTADLNVFAEIAEMRRLAPHVPAARLLDSATRQGARALGFGADYGTIEPGKVARLLAVSVPPDVDDVEEWLVSGVEPEQLRWLET